MPAGVGQEDADLGVLDPPGGAGVLARDPGGVGPLLEEAGLVEDQDGVGVAEGLDDVGPQVVADLVGVPVGPAQQVLDAVGGVVADLLGELPGVLALHRGEQADEVGPDAVAGLAAGEPRPDPSGDRVELLPPVADVFGADGGAGAGHGLAPTTRSRQQVAPDDARIHTEYVTYESPQGGGKIKGLLARPRPRTRSSRRSSSSTRIAG